MNANKKSSLIYPELSFMIVGILFKVHREMGNKYQEKHYQKALEIEFEKEKTKFERELPVDIFYDNKKIGKYFLDFLIEDKIVLEIKATDKFKLSDYKQISSYLKSKRIKLGILANFRKESLEFKRILNPELMDY